MSFSYGYNQDAPSANYQPTVNGINSLNSPFIMQQQHQSPPPQPQNSLMGTPPPTTNWSNHQSYQSQSHHMQGQSSQHSHAYQEQWSQGHHQPSPPLHHHQQQHPHHHSVPSLHSTPHPQHIPHQRQMSQPNISGRMPPVPPGHAPNDPGRGVPVAMPSQVPYQDNDMIVARGLLDGSRSGKSYRLALEGLHLVDGKPAHYWKDYYLEHAHRINHLVMRLQDPNTKTLKKPSFDQFPPIKQEHRNGMPPFDPRNPYHSGASSQGYSREGSASARSATGGSSSAIGRRTQNSLSTPSAMYSEKMPPPNAEIQIPQAPSRSPTPPSRVESKGGTHMYTPEDKEYFIRFISWRLKRDPTLTRAELCDQLAQKAPQHSASSWGYHWQRTHDVADKILQAAQGGELPQAPVPGRRSRHADDDSDEEVITRTTKNRRAMKGVNNVHKAESTPPPSPPAVQSKVKIPEPPSRSPSPPPIIPNPSNRPARYTQADDDYLIKFIGWRLKKDPTLNRQEICEKLALKMPNHSANAWLSRWRRFNDGLPDAIFDAMHVEREEEADEDGEEDEEEEEEDGAGSDTSSLTEESDISDYKSRPKTRGAATGRRGRPTARRAQVIAEDEEVDAEGSDDEADTRQDDETTMSEDEKSMGESGEAFTDADLRVAARYIAGQPNWLNMTSKARWEGFIARYPGRSYKSWSEYYRRMEKKIDKQAKTYIKRRGLLGTSPAQPPPATPEDRQKESRTSDASERGGSTSVEPAPVGPPLVDEGMDSTSTTNVGSEISNFGTRLETLASPKEHSVEDAAPVKRKLDPDDEGDQTPPQKMARMDVEEPTPVQPLT